VRRGEFQLTGVPADWAAVRVVINNKVSNIQSNKSHFNSPSSFLGDIPLIASIVSMQIWPGAFARQPILRKFGEINPLPRCQKNLPKKDAKYARFTHNARHLR
jgi:hypothetical protein